MTSPYRNDIEALHDRKDFLEREIASLREQASELEELRARAHVLERELAAVADKLGARERRRALPMLEGVHVASPCSAKWDEMIGDERVRHCLDCQKNVYNLSAMGREEAERLLQERAGKELCVRFYRRADGTILTDDCPVGVKRRRRKKVALAVAGAGAMALAGVSTFSATIAPLRGEVLMGTVAIEEPLPSELLPPLTPPGAEGQAADDLAPELQEPVMGEWTPQPPQPVMGEWTPPPERPVMGELPPPPPQPVMGRRLP